MADRIEQMEGEQARRRAAALLRLPLFSSLASNELREVANCVTEHTFEDGERIVVEGETGQRMYVITEGEVSVTRKLSDRVIEIARLGDGSFFGEMSLIGEMPISATVTANEPTKAFAISRRDLDVLLSWNTELAKKFLRELSYSLANRILQTNNRFLEYCAVAEGLIERQEASSDRRDTPSADDVFPSDLEVLE